MMLFSSGPFAGNFDYVPCCLFVFIISGLIISAITFIICGIADCLKTTQKRKFRGVLKVFLGLLISLLIIAGPHITFYSMFGRFPASRQKFGQIMIGTPEERVLELLGPPMQMHVSWIYWFDAMQTDGVSITFDTDRKIERLFILP